MVINSVIKRFTAVFLFTIFLAIQTTIYPVFCLANTAILRSEFLKTENLIHSGKIISENQISKNLKSYSLYPYLEFELIKNQLRYEPVEKIKAFYNKYPNDPISRTMNHYWINHLAKKNRWNEVITYYIPNNSTNLKCLYYTALAHVSPEKITPEDISNLWLTGESRPKECDALFTHWINNNIVTQELIWQRIILAIDNNKPDLVKALGTHLPAESNEDVKLWLRVNKDLKLINHAKLFDANNDFHQKILIYALKKIAQKNIELSLRHYRDLNLRFQFTDPNKYDFYRFIAIRMFMTDHDKIELLLNDIPLEYFNEQLHTVAIKNALKNTNWPLVLKRIEEMPETLQKEDIWIYWLARAYGETKQPEKAKELYSSISHKINYYGLLACSNSKQLCPIEFAITQPYKADKLKLLNNPGVSRALEFYKIKRFTFARLEWNNVMKILDDKQKYIAANIASELNWHDRNIINLNEPAQDSKDKQEDKQADKLHSNAFLHFRYPLGYQDSVLKFAKKYNIDPAWVFAISRQESAFIVDAKSRAGALGLMQLMPATAQKLAKSNKIPYRNQLSLLNETTNIRLGSAYLQKMLDENKGNPVLATAAYNAGPGRVKKWLKDNKPIATDIWIELVPFYETRDYLKRVLTNTAIYRSRLGKNSAILSEVFPLTIENKKSRQ
ncbi:MAG: lytic transglycosylase domain-containing protein [Gammaproteobacteria bacterium]|nr:lytic transglycosylase domain-containing protein [Gammaproteobacteria bacterium]